jgi:hypothetical protein
MRAIRENINPILESYGVDILLAGHSHVYERSYLINGFYGAISSFNPAVHIVDGSSGRPSDGTPYVKYFDGPNPNLGTMHIVQGNSGSSESDAPLQHPAMFYGHGCDTCVGSTMIEANGDTLSGYYLTKDGEILDNWMIIKKNYPAGIDEPTLSAPVADLQVYPNPFRNETTCTFEVTRDLKAEVELIDLAGRTVHSFFKGKMTVGQKKFVVNAQELGLSKGSYLMRVISDQRPAVARLIKVE